MAKHVQLKMEDFDASSAKMITKEEFLASDNFGTLSGEDLYSVLRIVAGESNTEGEFCSNLSSHLISRLGGQARFVIVFDGGTMWYPRESQSQTWGGAAGALPGFNHSIQVFVWW